MTRSKGRVCIIHESMEPPRTLSTLALVDTRISALAITIQSSRRCPTALHYPLTDLGYMHRPVHTPHKIPEVAVELVVEQSLLARCCNSRTPAGNL
jgi:hypothetical protein